jgi:aminotransferase
MMTAGDFVNDKVREMPWSGIRKFFDVASEMEGVISLGVGEPDFDTPWAIREKGIYNLEKGKTVYSSNAGLMELRKEIAKYLKRTIGCSYRSDGEIIVTVGASESIDLALRATINEGEEVLVPEPSYVSYKPCVELADGVPVVINTKAENRFKLTVDDIKDRITNKTKALILPYPNNPTGAIMERADIEALAEFLKDKDILVISDEIYSELTYGEKKHCSIASIDYMRDKTIVINGFSKSFAMTGWRLGYAAGPKEIISAMTKIHQYCIMCAPTTSQQAAIEALRSCDNAVQAMRKEYDMRRRFMRKGFLDMGLDCYDAQGAFYLFPCIKSTGLSSEKFCERLLFEEKVAVVPGTAFGECGEGFIRCSYAYSVDEIRVALKKIASFVEKVRGEQNNA